MRFAVAQIGSRMHYAVPRAFEQHGMLESLHTDICASIGIGRIITKSPLSMLSGGLRRLAGRTPTGVPSSRITSEDLIGLRKAFFYRRRSRCRDFESVNLRHISEWCSAVGKRDPGAATHLYAFNSCALEIFQSQRWGRVHKILEQTIAPLQVEVQWLESAKRAFPEYVWESASNKASFRRACERQEREWDLADQIICASAFVKDGLISLGVPERKCKVIPYGFGRTVDAGLPRSSPRSGKLKVLFVGAVGLRKGGPVLLEVAKLTANIARVTVVGQVEGSPEFQRDLHEHCEVLGIVPRSQMRDIYADADVLLLPSFCEGSATVTYEAMNSGVPVICTENSGSTVVDGKSGFIVPAFSPEVIARLLGSLSADRSQLSELAAGALEVANSYTEEKYAARLIAELLRSDAK